MSSIYIFSIISGPNLSGEKNSTLHMVFFWKVEKKMKLNVNPCKKKSWDGRGFQRAGRAALRDLHHGGCAMSVTTQGYFNLHD